MKFDWQFSKMEWMGIVSLTVFILFAFGFYYLYEVRGAVGGDYAVFAEEMRLFQAEQQRLADSAAHSLDTPRTRAPTWKKNGLQQYYEIVKMDLNGCDTTDIMTVPRFGSKRARRLVEYRERLGGFYSFDQVHEVFVLQDMDIAHLEKYFYLDKKKVRKIKINSADYKTLSSHPYFDAYLTKMVMAYREKHGRVSSMEELQECTHAYQELIDKLAPYIEFD